MIFLSKGLNRSRFVTTMFTACILRILPVWGNSEQQAHGARIYQCIAKLTAACLSRDTRTNDTTRVSAAQTGGVVANSATNRPGLTGYPFLLGKYPYHPRSSVLLRGDGKPFTSASHKRHLPFLIRSHSCPTLAIRGEMAGKIPLRHVHPKIGG